MTDAVNYSNTAIVVIGRMMGEGNDFSKVQYISENSKQLPGEDGEDPTRKTQHLSEREEYMIQKVTENFENVTL